jgi:hypothetical protein
MTNTSVWVEEIDTALLSFIKSIVTVKGVPVHTFVRKPEDEFKIEKYPSVSIYNMYNIFDQSRYQKDNVKELERDPVNFTVTTQDSSIPYKFTYQVDFWSKYKTEMNEMTLLWSSAISSYINMPITDAGGVVTTCFVRRKASLVTRDYISGKERIYHSTATYEVHGYIDLGVTKTEKTVNEVIITSKEL